MKPAPVSLLKLLGSALDKRSVLRNVALGIAALFYVFAGVMHFLKPAMYLRIMPPYIPFHEGMVALSGVFEILGGVGLLIPRTRRAAAWGVTALLVAVFPANVYMATNPIETGTTAIPDGLRWGRLVLQPLLIWWVLWCSGAGSADRR